jgi:hypothetical protein
VEGLYNCHLLVEEEKWGRIQKVTANKVYLKNPVSISSNYQSSEIDPGIEYFKGNIVVLTRLDCKPKLGSAASFGGPSSPPVVWEIVLVAGMRGMSLDLVFRKRGGMAEREREGDWEW